MKYSCGLLLVMGSLVLLSGCSSGGSSGSSQSSSKQMAADYCPHLPSKSFSDPVNFSGKAFYQYRVNGNGEVADGGLRLTPVINPQTSTEFSFQVNGCSFSWTSPASFTSQDVVSSLKALVNAQPSCGISADGTSQLEILPVDPSTPVANYSSNSRLTLTSHLPAKPIRFAEVRIVDGAGAIVQCAETNSSGQFSVQLPKGVGTVSVQVASRAENSVARAYVLNNPTENKFHSVSRSLNPEQTSSAVFLASATGSLEGGAFNILDQIIRTNEFLRTQTAGCNSSGNSNFFNGCDPFSSAPLVYAYWSKGVNPGTYFGLSSGISFYLNGDHELYLLGGINGNIDSSDTDHFDNSVIIHEYSHFLEDAFAHPDSPGGSHNGNSVIDPRLAWGEGFANFLQAAVTGNPVYRDTYGNISCNYSSPGMCTGAYFNVDLETPTNNSPTYDVATVSGEGNFREFSVSRMLWDTIDPFQGVGGNDSGNDTVQSPFSLLWTALSSTSHGLRNPNLSFRSVGLFNNLAVNQGANLDSALSNEKQVATQRDYATPITLGNSCSAVSIAAVKGVGDNGSFATSNQFRNNDFYQYNHPGGALNIQLQYDRSMGTPPDLDLYLYRDGYIYGETEDMAGESNNSGDGGVETISVSPPAGKYMINVMVFTQTSAGSPTTYTLRVNGQLLCPNP